MWIFLLLSLNPTKGSCAFSIVSVPKRATAIWAHLWILYEHSITLPYTSCAWASSEMKDHVTYEAQELINCDSIFIALIYRELKIP